MIGERLPQFRPGLLIFVGEVGEQIRHQLMPPKLLALLDRPLRQGVGLIQFPAKEDGSLQDPDQIPARSWLVRDMFPDTSHRRQIIGPGGIFLPHEEAPLKQVLWNMLNMVQAEDCLQDLKDAGYDITNSHTQVYIVGDATSEWMGYVLQTTRELPRIKSADNTEVCYVLSRYEPGIGGPTDWIHRSDWDRRELANFCFIYENAMRPYTGYLRREQSYYTAAEALFALVATGITTQDEYKDAMKLTPSQNSYQQVGNLSSSLIIFPYSAVRDFCSAHMGTELMDDWINDIIGSKTSDPDRKRQQESARRVVDEIKRWIEDSEIRPGTESLNEKLATRQSKDKEPHPRTRVSKWPTLDILRRGEGAPLGQQQPRTTLLSLTQEERKRLEALEQQEERERENQLGMYRRLRDQTRSLFEFFSFKSVQKEYREHRHQAETWADIAYQRSGTASNTFVNWDRLATEAWWAASRKASSTIQRTVDRIWPPMNNGFDLARIYITEYEDKLSELATLLSAWRKAHKKDYEDALAEFEQLAEGEWAVTESDPNSPSGRVRPTGANAGTPGNRNRGGIAGPAQSPPGANVPGSQGQQQQQASLHKHLPPRENEIAQHLGQRVTWEQSRVPSRVNLGATGLLAIPALALSTLALVPTLATTLLATVLVFVVVAGLVGLGGWMFYWLQRRNVVKLQKDLLKFYSLYYAHRCEVREDQLRLSVISPLHLRVQGMRERLDDMIGFLTLVSNGLEHMANEAHDNLLLRERNPAAVRDIYVGNGAILQRTERLMIDPHETPAEIRQHRIDRRTFHTASRDRWTERRATNTLEDFAARIRGKCLGNARKEPWHNPVLLRERLLTSFQTGPQSIIEMSLEETQQYICEFTRRVIDAYLKDPDLVDVGNVLDLEEIWKQVFDRMERPVYRSQVGNPFADLVLVCGYRPKVDRGQKILEQKQRGAIRVNTNNPEWVLVAGVLRDRSPAYLDADVLFPPKP